MKSKAELFGHPLHPILIPFPLAFLTGAFVFDAAGVALGSPTVWTTGAYLSLAGIGTAALAAVPGLIDFLYQVPPRSSAKRRATFHMISALTAVALFGLAWLGRSGFAAEPSLGVIGAELIGLVALGSAGWLGGTLVYRNQIAVDHRYAGAGQWREATIQASEGESVVVARRDELGINQMKLLRVNGGRRIVLARTESGYVAFDDRCTHRGGPLADGALMGGIVQCPWHGSQFDVTTGRATCGPATEGIATYSVEQTSGDVRLVFGASRKNRTARRGAA
jgi:nitrite reductase/ring-hydroxylating ferredoxin subunit/uncharacterized membrane protein